MAQEKVLSLKELEERKGEFVRNNETALSGALLFLQNINEYTKNLAEEVGTEEMEKIMSSMLAVERGKINVMLAEIEREIRKFKKM